MRILDDIFAPKIASLKAKGDIAGLAKALEHKNDEVRFGAAVALAGLGDVRGVDHLIALLFEQKDTQRTAAAQALGQAGDIAVEPLITMLSKSPPLSIKYTYFAARTAAADVLGQIGDIRAVDTLIKQLHSQTVTGHLKSYENLLRAAAARALGRIGAAHAVPELIAALKEPNTVINEAVQEALLQLGEPAIRLLESALDLSDQQVARSAAKILEQLAWQPVDGDQHGLFLFLRRHYDQAAAEPRGADLLVQALKRTAFTIYERYGNGCQGPI